MAKRVFKYEIKDAGNQTYVVNEFFSTMFVLCGEKRALVIDCGVGVGDFKSVIEEITPLPYDVVLTHVHADHVGGRGQFTDVFVSETDSKYIKGVNYIQRLGFVGFNNLKNKFSGLEVHPIEKEPTVHIIKEGDEFDLGNRTVRVYSTPGHTAGSVSFLDVERRTLFVGDAANDYLFMFLPRSTTIDELIEMLEYLKSIDGYDIIWPSHHSKAAVKSDIDNYIECARQVGARKKNALFPYVKVNEFNGARLFYRPSHIHKK